MPHDFKQTFRISLARAGLQKKKEERELSDSIANCVARNAIHLCMHRLQAITIVPHSFLYGGASARHLPCGFRRIQEVLRRSGGMIVSACLLVVLFAAVLTACRISVREFGARTHAQYRKDTALSGRTSNVLKRNLDRQTWRPKS